MGRDNGLGKRHPEGRNSEPRKETTKHHMEEREERQKTAGAKSPKQYRKAERQGKHRKEEGNDPHQQRGRNEPKQKEDGREKIPDTDLRMKKSKQQAKV